MAVAMSTGISGAAAWLEEISGLMNRPDAVPRNWSSFLSEMETAPLTELMALWDKKTKEDFQDHPMVHLFRDFVESPRLHYMMLLQVALESVDLAPVQEEGINRERINREGINREGINWASEEPGAIARRFCDASQSSGNQQKKKVFGEIVRTLQVAQYLRNHLNEHKVVHKLDDIPGGYHLQSGNGDESPFQILISRPVEGSRESVLHVLNVNAASMETFLQSYLGTTGRRLGPGERVRAVKGLFRNAMSLLARGLAGAADPSMRLPAPADALTQGSLLLQLAWMSWLVFLYYPMATRNLRGSKADLDSLGMSREQFQHYHSQGKLLREYLEKPAHQTTPFMKKLGEIQREGVENCNKVSTLYILFVQLAAQEYGRAIQGLAQIRQQTGAMYYAPEDISQAFLDRNLELNINGPSLQRTHKLLTPLTAISDGKWAGFPFPVAFVNPQLTKNLGSALANEIIRSRPVSFSLEKADALRTGNVASVFPYEAVMGISLADLGLLTKKTFVVISITENRSVPMAYPSEPRNKEQLFEKTLKEFRSLFGNGKQGSVLVGVFNNQSQLQAYAAAEPRKGRVTKVEFTKPGGGNQAQAPTDLIIQTGWWSVTQQGRIPHMELKPPSAVFDFVGSDRKDEPIGRETEFIDPLYLAELALFCFPETGVHQGVVLSKHPARPRIGFTDLMYRDRKIVKLTVANGPEPQADDRSVLLPYSLGDKDIGSYLTRSMFLQHCQQELLRRHPHRDPAEILALSPLGLLLQGSRAGLTREQRMLLHMAQDTSRFPPYKQAPATVQALRSLTSPPTSLPRAFSQENQ